MWTCNATDRPGRRLARGAVALLGVCLLALNLMALIGLLARDRSVLLAILFYLRLLPLGGAAIAFDLTRRGRGIAKPRFLLAAIGLVTVACSGWEMIGRGPEVPSTPWARPEGEVRLLHWNVLWGGGRRRNQARWDAIVDDIQRRRPDVVVLSEAPPEPWITSLSRRMGAA